MEYVINSIFKSIVDNTPNKNGEMMVRVDGFQDARVYEGLARKLSAYYKEIGMKINIKLAKQKLKSFEEIGKYASELMSMKQNDWIAESESVTYYRNEHIANILVLMGTEDEEDTGGLQNCFSITPDTISKNLKGKYNKVFNKSVEYMEERDKNVIDSLYKQLFEYVPFDICKLSNVADQVGNSVVVLDEFIERFFEDLPIWNMPVRRLDLPGENKIMGKTNVLQSADKFIKRTMFKNISAKSFEDYQTKIEKYATDKESKYTNDWEGWSEQAVSNFDELSQVMLSYMMGEEITENREKLLHTDFAIIEDIINIKLDKKVGEKEKDNITGEAYEVFLQILLRELVKANLADIELSKIEIRVQQANIACYMEETDSRDSILQENWENICCHVNGVIEYINSGKWRLAEKDIQFGLEEENFFNPDNGIRLIDEGIVKAAGATKKNHEIVILVVYKNKVGDIIPKTKHKYIWKFNAKSEWMYDFADMRNLDIDMFATTEEEYIPIAVMPKLKQIMFSKSTEEFFDIYDENILEFKFNLVTYIKNNIMQDDIELESGFSKLGKQFYCWVKKVKTEGFYRSVCGKESEASMLINKYIELGRNIVEKSIPENARWILNAFVHAFNIERDTNTIEQNAGMEYCIVPPWHPAVLEKVVEQKKFMLDGCIEWWNDVQELYTKGTAKNVINQIEHLREMSRVQSAVDIFTDKMRYFGSVGTYGAFSLYAQKDIKDSSRLKDLIRREAVFDEDFDAGEGKRMTDNAKMIYDVVNKYIKTFPDSKNNLSMVFIDPVELQSIVAAVHKYIENIDKNNSNSSNDGSEIKIQLKILVKPENKGGRNYLSYWMDEFFSEKNNVNIKTYINEWQKKEDLEKQLNGNADIIFAMGLLGGNYIRFIKDVSDRKFKDDICKFPMVYKPMPTSVTSVQRGIELTQPQFQASYVHTQVVKYYNDFVDVPGERGYIAVREVEIGEAEKEILHVLHEKAYWIVCIDSGIDGALLRNDKNYGSDYSIIGFSTGKGEYGQYNLTVTARKGILDIVRKLFKRRLRALFVWEDDMINEATDICMNEAARLDGISLLSAANMRDRNINEFMAYLLTARREEGKSINSPLRVIIHLDSYRHWFDGKIERDEKDSASRPDFAIFEIADSTEEHLKLKARVIECKMAGLENAQVHIEKALEQAKHGVAHLSQIFNPNALSVKRRYWYAQLYRALAFAQVTFSNNDDKFSEISNKLRKIMEGNFEIEWSAEVLGYWFDMEGKEETTEEIEGVKVYNIPQYKIQKLLLKDRENKVHFVDMEDKMNMIDGSGDEAELNRKHEYDDMIESMFAENVIDVNTLENVDDAIHDNRKEWPKKDNFVVEEETLNLLEDISVLIGRDRTGKETYWEFGNPKMNNRHVLITGTSGQGKTYCIQSMLYELMKHNISTIIFDYSNSFVNNQLDGEFINRVGDKIEQHYIYTEGVQINPFKRNEINIGEIKAREKASSVAARVSDIFGHVYNFGAQQSAAIFETVTRGIQIYDDRMNMNIFEEMLKEVEEENGSAKTVQSRLNPFFRTITFGENVIDWGKILYGEKSQIHVFQLEGIDESNKKVVTEFMLWDAFYYTQKYGSEKKPFIAILDEAQNLSIKDESPNGKILKEGRKFGWSAWFATQSLNTLKDEEITNLSQAGLKLNFKPTGSEITKVAKNLDPYDVSKWIGPLKKLEKGMCIADSTLFEKPIITSVTSIKERE